MKKTILSLSLAAIVSFSFVGLASANEVACMGSACNSPTGQYQWNQPDMRYNVDLSFGGQFNGGTDVSGYGTGPKTGQSYSVGEQSFEQKANVVMTDFLNGAACGGTCDQNKAQIGFHGVQTLETGGMQLANGTDHTGTVIRSGAGGHLGAAGSFNWD